MATQNVSYRHCTCDICGDSKDVPSSVPLPNGWHKISVRYHEADCCEKCLDLITNYINDLKRNTYEKNRPID